MSIDSVKSGNLSANGSTSWFKHAGGRLAVSLQGNFGGGTAVLQISFDDGTTSGTSTDIVSDAQMSVASGTTDRPYTGLVEANAGWYRWNLSGATSPDIDWKIEALITR